MQIYYEKGTSIVKEYFSEELSSIMKRQKVKAEKESFKYLVELLTYNLSSDIFFNKEEGGKLKEPIPGLIYLESISLPKEKKLKAIQKIGDICLFMTGFFPDALTRRTVTIDYYYELGVNAYSTLSSLYLSRLAKETFLELSNKFKLFSNVFSEMSEKANLKNNTDILSIYERWLTTGDSRLYKLLIENGIVYPLKINNSTKQ